MSRRTFTVDVTGAGTEHVWRITGDFYPGDPGRLSGPPERCYPPEPEDVEITGAKLLDPTGKQVLCDAIETELWAAMREEVALAIHEAACDAMREAYASEMERFE